jgi:hypothetical protein
MLGLLPTIVLAAAGLAPEAVGQYRGDPLLPPIDGLAVPSPSTTAADDGVLFVNFDGAELLSASEDARVNQTQIGFEGTFSGYGVGAKRDAVLQAVRADWGAYDIEVTDARPASGDYTMAMVGPTNFTEGSLGVALLDCDDAWTRNNIVYAFHQIDDGYSAAATATTIGQEVAHSFGLEHVDDPADVMHPYNLGGDPAFIDECIDIVPASFGILCEAQHERFCGTPTAQNSHRELLDLFGGSGPDTTAPTVRIESPGDGAVFDVGATFEIAVVAMDDEEVVRIELRDRERMFGDDTEAPWGWRVKSASEGEYQFVVSAIDAAGNEAWSEEIIIAVANGGDAGLPDDGSADEPVEPDDADDGRGHGRDATPGVDDSASGDVGLDDKDVRYHASDDPGLACRSGRAPSGLPLLFMLFAMRRRRVH